MHQRFAILADPHLHDVRGNYCDGRIARECLAGSTSFRICGSAIDGEDVLFSPGMRCRSYTESLPRALGFFRNGSELYWKLPFGQSDDLADRHDTLSSPSGRHVRRFIDASYLVEPVEGAWLLSIDGNVFVPRDGDIAILEEEFEDSPDAGYNALVAHRSYLLKCIADVPRRAAQLGKRLISFSHYPAVDSLDGTLEDEQRLVRADDLRTSDTVAHRDREAGENWLAVAFQRPSAHRQCLAAARHRECGRSIDGWPSGRLSDADAS